ncbi:MAG: class I SAM-dependent methyltransferase [Clostridiales bacterium]|nr:class I SAM-dependent methyltransferase [Clostridiales bacterium]
MAVMNDAANVARQYASDENLNKRIRLYREHSTSPVDFVAWLFERYRFAENDRILEMGCGNARQWEGRLGRLPAGCALVLTDLSIGMVDAAWRKFHAHPGVIALRADIQELPFPSGSFDAAIANHMLYHVPDLDAALAEVRRVLKPGGRFYAATNGDGMRRYLHGSLRAFNPALGAFDAVSPFSMENGRELLLRHFSAVEQFDFDDSLRVTQTQDLIDWIESTVAISAIGDGDLEGLFEYFEAIRLRDGAIHIPKEVGLFVAAK